MGERSNVIQIDPVRCLECGARYVKPADGGTVHENPGCPRCGYVGWISTTIPAASLTPDGPRRSAVDLRRHPIARAR
jgi:hypothetical protein